MDKMFSRVWLVCIFITLQQWMNITSSKGLPGVLFVFDSWKSNKGGLTAFHRELVNDFAIRKQWEVNIYSTVLHDDDSDDTRNIEEIPLNVNLIFPRIKKRLQNNKPNIEWLINHESFYPGLRQIKNIKNVIGYAPKTADAACEIRDSLFPNARLVLINHLIPDKDYMSNYDNPNALSDRMLKWAEEADIIFSIGPGMHVHFANEYRADLYEKPHKEYLPRPSDFFFAKEMYLPEYIDKHVILTYGQVEPNRPLCVEKGLVSAVCEFADIKRTMREKTTLWKFHDVAGSDHTEMASSLADQINNENVKISPSSSTSFAELAKHIQQSHLCLVATCYEEYSFDGLEAMAIGLPFLASEESQIAKYLTKYFAKYKNKCIVTNPAQNWPHRIRDVLVELVTAFETSKDLKQEFKESTNITDNHGMFAAVLEPDETTNEKYTPIKKTALNVDLPVNISLNESSYYQALSTIDCNHQNDQAMGTGIKNVDDHKANEVKLIESTVRRTWNACLNTLEQRLIKVERQDETWVYISDISRQCYAQLKDIKHGSAYLILQFSNLHNLYKFEGKCRSGSFSSLLEPILINDHMRQLASPVNISLQLKASYDQGDFVKVEAFFIKRDGGQRNKSEPFEGVIDDWQNYNYILLNSLFTAAALIISTIVSTMCLQANPGQLQNAKEENITPTEELTQQREGATKQFETLEDAKSQTKPKSMALESQLKEEKEKNVSLTNHIEELRQERDSATQQLTKLEFTSKEQISRLERQLKKEKAKNVDLTNLIEELRQEQDYATQQLTRRMSINSKDRFFEQGIMKPRPTAKKVIQDPIHGTIELESVYMYIIDTEEFQRLRNIKKLGTVNFVYPGAVHTRFEHSIGRCYLALKFAKHLKESGTDMSKEEEFCIGLAALCLDLGIGPFSRLFEENIVHKLAKHESKGWTRQLASVKIFEAMLEKYNLQSVFGLYRYNMNDILFHAVKEMICGPLKKGSYIKATTYQALSPSRHFLYDIVSNKTNLMNVDKWEGLSRDSFQCGLTQTRNIMHERFMKFAKVLQTPTEGEQMTAICYRDKVAADVCEMLQARYRQRELTTFHKVKIAVDLMISDAFEAAADHLTFTTQNGDIVRLASVLEDMDAYLMLDDKIIDTILQSYNNEMLRDSREIVERIQRRRLYKFVGRLRLPPRDDEQDDESVEADAIRLEKTTAEDIVRHHDNNGTLEASDLCLTTVSMDYGLENEHPIERMQFYRKDTETPIHIGRKEVSYRLEPTFLGKSLFIYVRNEARKDNAKRCIQQFARHCGLVIDNE